VDSDSKALARVPAGPATEASVSLRKAFPYQARFFASLFNYSSWKAHYSPHQVIYHSLTLSGPSPRPLGDQTVSPRQQKTQHRSYSKQGDKFPPSTHGAPTGRSSLPFSLGQGQQGLHPDPSRPVINRHPRSESPSGSLPPSDFSPSLSTLLLEDQITHVFQSHDSRRPSNETLRCRE
jgi:hypothetical protein